MKTSKPISSRRRFLVGAGVSTAAAAAVLVGTGKTSGDSAEERGAESKKGYQLTEHVRNYYRTAKI